MKKNLSVRKSIFFALVLLSLTLLTALVSSAYEETYSAYGSIYTYDDYYDEWYEKDTLFYAEGEEAYEFNGKKQKPSFKVYYMSDGKRVYLKENVDYTVSYPDSIYPSHNKYSYYSDDYSADIKSIKSTKYSFSFSFDYRIYYDYDKLYIKEIAPVMYTGDYIEPEVNVYYGNILLDSEQFTCEFDDNYSAGTATVYVSVYDEYGSCADLDKSFTILPVPASSLKFSNIPDCTYCAEYQEPNIEVYYNNHRLDDDDYWIDYYDNIEPGTAKAVITFYENFSGTRTLYFTIKKASASSVHIEKVEDQYYTGKKVKPHLYVVTDDYDYLEEGEDYTVVYKNNLLPGKATATLTFINGLIEGTREIRYNIIVPEIYDLYAESSENKVCLNYYASGYYEYNLNYNYNIYKYNEKEKKYKKIKTTGDHYYYDSNVKELTTYKYRVRVSIKIDDKTYYGKYANITFKTPLFSPKEIKLTTKKGSIKINWTKCKNATGYILYRYDAENDKIKKLLTTKKNTVLSFTDKKVKNYRLYGYYVVAYRKSGTKTIKSNACYSLSSLDLASISRGVELNKKTSYRMFNTQGKTTTELQSVKLSKNDIKTLQKFAKKHFKKGMTAYDKAIYTLDWIHENVTYASSSKNWNKISNKTYVDAIFNYKLGQCLQYNGALAGMMSYLGFDVKLIMGYRQGSYKVQHFWVECELNGLTYVMECGNHKDGGWHYAFVPYRYTSGYVKNGKKVSN